ncbi:MAG: methylenetetrahydrofolate reductase [Alistipes sp.]|nr:methylenetetrahydrofolate reductase [Candidatus Minthomonas equi]
MKISDILSAGGKPFPSIEIVPPLKGITKSQLLDSIRPFMEFRPPYINVTRHRDEYEFICEADGSFSRHTVRRRISETAVCAAIQSEFDTEVVPHIICAGADADNIETQLHDLKFMGISNLMLLRGDSLTTEKSFTPEAGGYSHASDLVKAVRNFGNGNDTSFCIGVGAYPEKHFEAANIESDIEWLKFKVDCGADFIITQMFFDNAVFYRFRDRCREAGISVPIIPGLKPLSSARQLDLLPSSFSIDIPQELEKEMRAHTADKDACYIIGSRWCAAQCRDLLANGVPAVHFYTMGRQDNVIGILKDCF